jgi:type III secretory pathway component EscU
MLHLLYLRVDFLVLVAEVFELQHARLVQLKRVVFEQEQVKQRAEHVRGEHQLRHHRKARHQHLPGTNI